MAPLAETNEESIVPVEIPMKRLEHTRFGLPELGLGTWQVGGRDEADRTKDEEEVEAIRAAIRSGVTHIDTAEVYGVGHAEELIGAAITSAKRSTLLLTSKVHPDNYRRERVVQACEKSLQRLGTSYLDLYLLHWYSPDIPLAEPVEALNELVDRKLVKHIGVSNFSKERLKEAQSLSKRKIVCDQVYYNLQAREPYTSGLLDYCEKNDVLVVAYRPIEKGKLLEGVPPLMEELCVKYQKTAAQIALNWLISQQNVVTIVKMSNRAHLKENLGALGWNMTTEDIKRVQKEYPEVADPDLCLD